MDNQTLPEIKYSMLLTGSFRHIRRRNGKSRMKYYFYGMCGWMQTRYVTLSLDTSQLDGGTSLICFPATKMALENMVWDTHGTIVHFSQLSLSSQLTGQNQYNQGK
jgi:hypothetical protein